MIPGLRSLILRYGRTEAVAERTGVPAETVVRLAKDLGTASRPVAVWDQSVSWRGGGLADGLAIHTLNILIDALGRPGGVLVQPPIPLPPIAPKGATTLGRERTAPDASSWADRVVAETPSPVDTLLLYYANPVASSPDARQVKLALERIPLVVSFSPFLDETARWAGLVLPDHTYLERWQGAAAPSTVPIPVWGVVQPMVPPLHDTRATGEVVLDLASRLGGDVAAALPWSTLEELVEERGKALAEARRGGVLDQPLRREELRELEARGYWLPHGESKTAFWASIREAGLVVASDIARPAHAENTLITLVGTQPVAVHVPDVDLLATRGGVVEKRRRVEKRVAPLQCPVRGQRPRLVDECVGTRPNETVEANDKLAVLALIVVLVNRVPGEDELVGVELVYLRRVAEIDDDTVRNVESTKRVSGRHV